MADQIKKPAIVGKYKPATATPGIWKSPTTLNTPQSIPARIITSPWKKFFWDFGKYPAVVIAVLTPLMFWPIARGFNSIGNKREWKRLGIEWKQSLHRDYIPFEFDE
ncbi:uncharacterized protein LOC106175330 [Lingula anatina]|uniref:Uncharacterized protein LOC106175330 n=1 Tax=Lingula anatina TaxID=7574 RepID=A0A1S3JQT7_LINAN|nr:uncharacterized protein LOC106175330 [Lingula anatina]|eukprot:XP_013412725.1 uncharacterized protein LOC106175330 [Lingula anatina]